MEFIAIDSERLIPQQSISSVTNIDDLESYIRSTESEERRYLQIVDLPLKERPLVMRELSMMGITNACLRDNSLNPHGDDCADACKGEGHHGNQRAIAQADEAGPFFHCAIGQLDRAG